MTPSPLTIEGVRVLAYGGMAQLHVWWDSLSPDQQDTILAEFAQRKAERRAFSEEWNRRWNVAHTLGEFR